MNATDLWWHLPGPAQFVCSVADDLRAGNNLVICMPEHAPRGLEGALRRELGDDLAYGWNQLDLESGNGDGSEQANPARLLFDRFAPSDGGRTLPNTRGLVEAGALAGHLFWVDGLATAHWSAWKRFLSEYAHACRPLPLLRRGVFCMVVTGAAAALPPPGDAGLAVRVWEDVVDSADMLLFASALLRPARVPPLQRQLHACIAAHLALWDPEVCMRLVAERPVDLTRPTGALQDIARERNWSPDDCRQPCWARGTADRFQGSQRTHSSALALDDAEHELERRVWSAEAAVILPFIEECRRDLLNRLGPFLRVPFRPDPNSRRTIDDLRDLEIGHIDAQIANNRKVDPKTSVRVRRLKLLRNALAHLEPVDVSDVLAIG